MSSLLGLTEIDMNIEVTEYDLYCATGIRQDIVSSSLSRYYYYYYYY